MTIKWVFTNDNYLAIKVEHLLDKIETVFSILSSNLPISLSYSLQPQPS